MLEKKNYKHNLTVPLEKNTVINGQACGEVANMRYGFFPMSYNGCEMIALHNSAVLLGKESDLKEVCLEMYRRTQSLSGLFGSNPYLLGSYFKKHSIPCKKTYSYKKFFEAINSSHVAVLSFWCSHKPFHGLHTVAVQKKDSKIIVYNRYNNRDYPYEYESEKELLPKKSDFICGYILSD